MRDAQALHALSCDNLGETATPIVDEDASARLIDKIAELSLVSTQNNAVMIGLSRHSSDTHEQITYDTDPGPSQRPVVHMPSRPTSSAQTPPAYR